MYMVIHELSCPRYETDANLPIFSYPRDWKLQLSNLLEARRVWSLVGFHWVLRATLLVVVLGSFLNTFMGMLWPYEGSICLGHSVLLLGGTGLGNDQSRLIAIACRTAGRSQIVLLVGSGVLERTDTSSPYKT